MDEGPTRERVNSSDSQENLPTDVLDIGPADASPVKGVCRAEISPPAEPLGESAGPEWDEIEIGKDAMTTDTKTTVAPALKLRSGDSDDLFSKRSNFSDIVVCEPPAAHMAMLELKLPSRMGRRSSRSVMRAAVGCAAEQALAGAALAEERPMPNLPPRGEIARLASKRSGGVPKRIGSGALVPAKLTWMPKDPFGNGVQEKAAPRFRWELMLTSACVTAATLFLALWLFSVAA
ncbi:MAG: hypothetical protein IPK83_14860 [Planctomycetes bacterium]|nr:hypothetical protein [Planctomycetota bacterium]